MIKQFLLVILFLLIQVQSVSAGVTVSMCENDIPPWVIVNDDKSGIKETSLIWRLVDEIFKRVEGVEIDYQLLPWKRCQSYVEKGRIDGILFFSKSVEREEKYRFTDSTINYPEGFLYSKSKYPDGLIIDDYTQLAQYTLGTLRGHSYPDGINKLIENGQLKHATVESTEQNMKKLMSGRVDLIVEGIVNARYELRHKGLDDKIGVVGGNLRFLIPMYMAFNRNSVAVGYMDQINKAIEEVKSAGIPDALLEEEY